MLKKLCIYIPSILVLLFVLEWQYARKYLFYEKKTMLPLEVALQAAGGNKKELQKVLHYYKKNPIDSLKYKAACFLIENMPFYIYSSGEQLENYKSYYAWLKVRKGKTAQQVSDSVKKVFGAMKEPKKKRDIMEMDSAYSVSYTHLTLPTT